ncbi:MAG TPA: S1C family serine protease, partial [Vicinamibacteria bacterium]
MKASVRGLTFSVLMAGLIGCEVVAEPPASEASDTRPVESSPDGPVAPAAPAPAPPPPAAPAETQANQLEDQVMRVFETAGPGVVNITSRSISYDFFLRAMPQEGSGSGFVYDDRGHIVTNFHVIEGASELHVTSFDETRVPAQVVGFDPS